MRKTVAALVVALALMGSTAPAASATDAVGGVSRIQAGDGPFDTFQDLQMQWEKAMADLKAVLAAIGSAISQASSGYAQQNG